MSLPPPAPTSVPALVSVLVPAYNEEANVERAYAAITRVFEALPGFALEIIFTDNHSTDATYERLAAIAADDPRVKIIRFARNFGYHRSVLFAYQAATGACAIQVDCDLQDPPALIPQMLALWQQGHQVVYGVRRSLPDGALTRTARRMFYRLISLMSDDDLPLDAGEFRLVDRQVLDELRKVEDTSPYVRGLISAMGFSQVGFLYDRQDRIAGSSKFPFRRMVSMALDGLLNHSLVPLRLASGIALTVGTLTFLLLCAYLVGRLVFGQDWPAGFATTTLLLLLSITLNAMCFGILGEYVGRIFMQAKRRPLPIVERMVNFDRPARPASPPATGAPQPAERLHAVPEPAGGGASRGNSRG
jgi:dolichol-phosphate mannosyltransferase